MRSDEENFLQTGFSLDRRQHAPSLESHQCELPALALPPALLPLVLPDLELGLSSLDSVHVRAVWARNRINPVSIQPRLSQLSRRRDAA